MIKSNAVPGIINALSDDDIIDKLLGSEELRHAVARLLPEIYEDDELAELREELRSQTITPNDGNRGILDVEGIDGAIRAISRIRRAVTVIWKGPHKGDDMGKSNWKAIVTGIKDGDLAMTHSHDARGDLCIDGEDVFAWIEEHKPIFSPEFQVDMVREMQGGRGEGFHIFRHIFQEKQLSKHAWRALLEGPMTNLIVRLILHEEIDPEILDIIQGYPKYDLIYRAREDASAQMELYNSDGEYELDMHMFLAAHPGLVNEEVVRSIAEGENRIARSSLGRNEAVLERMPWLKELIGKGK
ncbi:hypothetical protein HOG48_02645 [Candidatus Peregrinibacteria bacterium]|jgi:hypothetical protein|nr:hypothetical protein [Candidatus Peregrinibacteria bacterium]